MYGSLLLISSISSVWIHTFLYFEHFKNLDTQPQSFETSWFVYLETNININEDFNLQQHLCDDTKLRVCHGPLFPRLLNNTFTHLTEYLQLCLFLTRSFSVKLCAKQSHAFVVGHISRYVKLILRFLIFFAYFSNYKNLASVEPNTTHTRAVKWYHCIYLRSAYDFCTICCHFMPALLLH
jgi:hypothetical protein